MFMFLVYWYAGSFSAPREAEAERKAVGLQEFHVEAQTWRRGLKREFSTKDINARLLVLSEKL